MPHLHLSLQAGDDMILKRMKRRHRARRRRSASAPSVRGLRPDIVFGADLIAGFPTETEAMFAAHRSTLVEDCGLDPSPRLPLLARARHAGGAHAAGSRADVVKERARAPARGGGARLLARCLAGEVGAAALRPDGAWRRLPLGPVPSASSLTAPPPPGTISPVTITGQDGRILFGRAGRAGVARRRQVAVSAHSTRRN